MGWCTTLQENFKIIFLQLMKYKVLSHTWISGLCTVVSEKKRKKKERGFDQDRMLSAALQQMAMWICANKNSDYAVIFGSFIMLYYGYENIIL